MIYTSLLKKVEKPSFKNEHPVHGLREDSRTNKANCQSKSSPTRFREQKISLQSGACKVVDLQMAKQSYYLLRHLSAK